MKVIISILIIIICLLIIFTFEHFTVEDGEALNNVIKQINGDGITVETLNVSKLGESTKQVMMELAYPLDSLFFTAKEYNLDDKESLKNTPLYYGKWEELNKNEGEWNDFIFGMRRKGLKDPVYWGEYKLSAANLPPHKHKYQYNPSRNSMYNKNSGYAWNARDGLTDADIYDSKGNKIDKQTDFHPRGYYAYGYRKIEL